LNGAKQYGTHGAGVDTFACAYVRQFNGSKIATGVFLGVSVMFAQMELLLFAIFVNLGQQSGGAEAASNKAFASFALFMSVLYGIFSAFLYSVRDVVSGGACFL